jgi:uncharacterized protein YjbJ (UPF0337 family)
MNTTTLRGNWNIVKGKLKQQYGSLTEDDLEFAEGKGDELVGRIQKRLGKSREEVQRMLDDADREACEC